MNRIVIVVLCLLVGSLSSLGAFAQTTRHVSTGGSDHENLCSNAANPCRTIGRAIDVATSGDPIQVAAGIYTETLNIGKSVSIIGDHRDNTVIQAHPLAGLASRNVIRLSGGPDVEIQITDVTIRHGRAVGEIDLGNLTNIAGGGIFNDGVTLSADRVNLTANWAMLGGGMFNRQSSPQLTDIMFSGNTSLGGGGMVNFINSSPHLRDVTFSSNTAATGSGGGMVNSGNSSPTLVNVVFSANFAAFEGGGMSNSDNSNATLINVAFSANVSSEYGGGMGNFGSIPTLVNVTFNGNQAWNGGAISNYESDMVLTNVIAWNNHATDEFGSPISPSIYNDTSTPVITHSLIELSGGSGAGWNPQMGSDGGGNLDINPMFIAPLDPEADTLSLGGNLRLNPGSPAIDAGNDTPFEPGGVAEGVTTDLDGLQRIFGSAVDMGAHEFVPDPTVFVDRFQVE